MRVVNPLGDKAPAILDGMEWELIEGVGRVSPELSEEKAARYLGMGWTEHKEKAAAKAPDPPVSPDPEPPSPPKPKPAAKPVKKSTKKAAKKKRS
jgi:hypothetical protein